MLLFLPGTKVGFVFLPYVVPELCGGKTVAGACHFPPASSSTGCIFAVVNTGLMLSRD